MTYAVNFGYEEGAYEEAKTYAFPSDRRGHAVMLKMTITPSAFPLLAERVFKLALQNNHWQDVPVETFADLNATAIRINGKGLKPNELVALQLEIGRINSLGEFEFTPYLPPSREDGFLPFLRRH